MLNTKSNCLGKSATGRWQYGVVSGGIAYSLGLQYGRVEDIPELQAGGSDWCLIVHKGYTHSTQVAYAYALDFTCLLLGLFCASMSFCMASSLAYPLIRLLTSSPIPFILLNSAFHDGNK